MNNVSTYHMLLRVSAFTIALILLFDSGLLSPVTRTLSQNAQSYLANSVSMMAGVEPNEINTLTAQLTEQRRMLDAREAALSEREMSIGLSSRGIGANSGVSTYILSIILFILLVLIVLNYALDFARFSEFKRRRRRIEAKTI